MLLCMDPRIRDSGRGISIHLIVSTLSSVLAEWVVIFLLFLDGFLSYFLRRFARYSNLHPPCLLCSNLDRFLSQEREINLDDLICYEHKREIVASIRDRGFDIFKPKIERENSCDDQERLIQGEPTFSHIEEDDPIKKEDHFMAHLPHISYKEVKVTSDSEEEVEHEDIPLERETAAAPLETKAPNLIPIDESDVVKPVESDPTHGLEELNWNVIYEKDQNTLKHHLSSESSSFHVTDPTNPTEKPPMQVSVTKDHMDITDAYKMAISYRMHHGSPMDSPLVNDDLKSFMSHISSSRGFEISSDDHKPLDTPTASIHRNLSRKYSFDRNESGAESMDGSSMISEIEGENPEEGMKRQIEVDRKSMALLYKELEEERNASAISANQAMAMITRLQEEKAAMQMEALQYQRMMEEQSEYDQEAMQNLTDALTMKEAELEDAKAEIQKYRKMLDERETLDSVDFDFDSKKEYISECLRMVEKKICYPDHGGERHENGSSKKQEYENGSDESIIAQVLEMDERLKALEDDRSFIENIVKSLRHDDDAIEFVREIASHLQEIRQMGMKRVEKF